MGSHPTDRLVFGLFFVTDLSILLGLPGMEGGGRGITSHDAGPGVRPSRTLSTTTGLATPALPLLSPFVFPRGGLCRSNVY